MCRAPDQQSIETYHWAIASLCTSLQLDALVARVWIARTRLVLRPMRLAIWALVCCAFAFYLVPPQSAERRARPRSGPAGGAPLPAQPPPPPLGALLDALWRGHGIYLYIQP